MPDKKQEVILFLIFATAVFFLFFSVLPHDKQELKLSFRAPPADKQIEAFIKKVRESGVLPPVEEDLILDRSYDLISQDFNIVIEHSKTEQYLKFILSNLQKSFPEEWRNRFLRLRLYDDRFVGKLNNAFALPAGTIFVGVTQVLSAGSEAELAALLGHESSHFILRHTAKQRQISKNFTILEQKAFIRRDIQGSVLLDLTKQRLLGWLGFPGDLQIEIESQADKNSQMLLRSAGYNDLALVPLLERVEKLSKDKFLSAIMLKRVVDIKLNSEIIVLKKQKGKDYVVSKPEDLFLVRASLQQHLNDAALK